MQSIKPFVILCLYLCLAISASAVAQQEPPLARQAAAGWKGKSVRQWSDLLADEDERVRWYATYALGQLGPKAADAVPALMALLEDTQQYEYVRGAAAWALGRIGDRQAVPLLTETLESKHVSVRRNAPLALGNLEEASKEAVPKLLELVKDPDATVRVNSAVALWKIEKHQRAVPALVEMIQKGAGPAPYEATVALGRLEADPSILVPGLTAALQRDDPDVRRAAARAIGKIGPVAIPQLAGPLADPNPAVRRAAVEALGWMGEPAVKPLIVALGNEAPEARAAAARALGRLGPKAKAAGPKLIETINDRNPEVREAVAKAIKEIRKQ